MPQERSTNTSGAVARKRPALESAGPVTSRPSHLGRHGTVVSWGHDMTLRSDGTCRAVFERIRGCGSTQVRRRILDDLTC